MKIRTFDGLPVSHVCQSLNLSDNKLSNFEGMRSWPHLAILYLDDNPIKSFAGILPLPRLHWLSLRRADICRSKYFRLMCVVAFGPQLRTLNDRSVTPQEHAQAGFLRESLLPELRAGRIVSKLSPLRLISLKENSRQTPNTGLLDASIAPPLLPYATPRVLDIVQGLKSARVGERRSIAQIAAGIIAGTLNIATATRARLIDGIAALRARAAESESEPFGAAPAPQPEVQGQTGQQEMAPPAAEQQTDQAEVAVEPITGDE
jgi:hypothetical protein